MGTYRSGATMTMIQMAEWEWPEDTRFLICTPLSHAGAAFFIPTLLTGGAIVVLPHFEPGLLLETIEKYRITATMLVPTMLYVLLDHPKLDTDRRVEPADRLLRRGRVLADAAAGGDQAPRPDLLPVLRAGRVPDGDHVAEEGRPRRERPRAARHLRPPDAVGEGSAARRRLQRGAARRARRDLRAGAARDGGLLEEAGRDRRGVARRLAAHRRHRRARTSTASTRSSTARRT